MFERFEEDAVKAILLARDLACRHGHGAVGTEHLLVGLASSDAKIEALLGQTGPGHSRVAEALATEFGQGSPTLPGDLPFGPDAQRAFSVAWAIAEEFRHPAIAPLHLLMAILRADSPRLSRVLTIAGVQPDSLLAAIRTALSPVTAPRIRGGFCEESQEIPTPYGPVTLTLLVRPDAGRQSARILSLASDTVSGPSEVLEFLEGFDRLLDASGGALGTSFLQELFTGLANGLAAYRG